MYLAGVFITYNAILFIAIVLSLHIQKSLQLQRHIRPEIRLLVLLIHKHQFRLMRSHVVFMHLREGGDDDEVAGAGSAGG